MASLVRVCNARRIAVPADGSCQQSTSNPLENPSCFISGQTLGRSQSLGAARLQLDVVLDAHARDLLDLGLEEIDVVLLVFEDILEQVAADIVADGFGMGDRHPQIPD